MCNEKGAPPFSYQLEHISADGKSRCGVFHTPHGEVQTPAFMPVGTLGTVKGLTIEMVRQTGAQMVLGNTYHLTLRPGEEIVAQLGGLHKFMGWDGPILTDSGGFQIFSLAKITKVTEEAAFFRSHIDGRLLELSPEQSIKIQETLGSDVAMVLDQVAPLPSPDQEVRETCERTIRWARRSRDASVKKNQALFAIVQGGLDAKLRVDCAEKLVAMDFPGYAIGGLSVGEEVSEMYRILDATCPALPEDRPRYLMGVGRPQDILEAIRRGVDLFDCVIPTRNGRNALAYTDQGPLRMRNQSHQRDQQPLQAGCPCPACRHSRGYIRHLFMAGEMLGPILLSAHNLTYYQQLISSAKEAILEDRFERYYQQKMSHWKVAES